MISEVEFSEQDRKNCPFYHKIGACRHGDTCNREHHRPLFSQTVVIKQMYYNPMIPIVNSGQSVEATLDPATYQLVVDDFYEEVVTELANYGQLEDVQVMENLTDHMIGSVYAKFADEEQAEKCLEKMNGRFYSGRKLFAEYTCVTDFSGARCRTYDEGSACKRGAWCNFMHVMQPSKALLQYIKTKFGFTPCTRGVGTMATIGAPAGARVRGARGNLGSVGRGGRDVSGAASDSAANAGRRTNRRSTSRSTSRSRSRSSSRDRDRDREAKPTGGSASARQGDERRRR